MSAPVVDAHVHLFPDRLIEAVRAWFDAHAWNIRYRAGVDACVAELLSDGIDRVVALPYVHQPGLAAALNEFTRDVARRHPQVVPCCTVFPGEDGEERLLDEALAPDAAGRAFHGVKIHCHVMRLGPDDPRLDATWRASARHQKPVVIHCGRAPALEGYGVDVYAVSGAARLRRALERHPDAIAIVPHLGANEFAAFEALLDELPNLYLDTAMVVGGFFPAGPELELLRRRPGRILYGTDFPNLPYDWRTERAALAALALPAATQDALMGGTAARLFGIPQ